MSHPEHLAEALDESPLRVVVVGAGLAGLAAARDLARPGFAVTLVAAQSNLGSRPVEFADQGAPLEFANRDGALRRLLEELELAPAVERPATEDRWLALAPTARGGSRRLVREPAALLLGMPASPLANDVTAVLGRRGAWRAYLDRLRPVLTIGQERRLDRLVLRRMGRGVLELLVTPAALARFGVLPERLDVAHAVPGLNPALTRTGTLSGAVAELLAEPRPVRAGLASGLSQLLRSLAADAARRGATLLESAATRVSREPGEATDPARSAGPDTAGAESDDTEGPSESDDTEGPSETHPWRIGLADGTEVHADVVLLAVGPADALALTAELRAEAAEPQPPELLERDEVTLLLRSPALEGLPIGAGAIVAARDESTLVELVHETARWPSLRAEVGAGRHVLRLRYPRSGSEAEAETTVERALREASEVLGIDLTGELEEARVSRVVEPAPAALLGQTRRITRLRDALHALGLEVTGQWLAGTDPADVVEHAAEAATRIRLARWRAL